MSVARGLPPRTGARSRAGSGPRVRTRAGTAAAVVGAVVGTATGAVLSTLVYRWLHPTVAPADESRIVVAAIGDSNTFGAGALAAYPVRSYPAQLQRLLGSGYQVLNFGFSGRTLLAGADLPYTAEAMFAQSRQVRADIVLIMLGTNDAKRANWHAEAFEPELAAFVRGYQRLPHGPRVHLLTPPAAFRNPYTVDSAVVADEIAPTVRRVAERTGAGLIDVFALFAHRPDLLPDGIHPSGEGYRLIAQAVYEAIAAG